MIALMVLLDWYGFLTLDWYNTGTGILLTWGVSKIRDTLKQAKFGTYSGHFLSF